MDLKAAGIEAAGRLLSRKASDAVSPGSPPEQSPDTSAPAAVAGAAIDGSAAPAPAAAPADPADNAAWSALYGFIEEQGEMANGFEGGTSADPLEAVTPTAAAAPHQAMRFAAEAARTAQRRVAAESRKGKDREEGREEQNHVAEVSDKAGTPEERSWAAEASAGATEPEDQASAAEASDKAVEPEERESAAEVCGKAAEPEERAFTAEASDKVAEPEEQAYDPEEYDTTADPEEHMSTAEVSAKAADPEERASADETFDRPLEAEEGVPVAETPDKGAEPEDAPGAGPEEEDTDDSSEAWGGWTASGAAPGGRSGGGSKAAPAEEDEEEEAWGSWTASGRQPEEEAWGGWTASGRRPEESLADLEKLSVKELKQKIMDKGINMPVGVTEKKELVELIRSHRPAPAAPPAGPGGKAGGRGPSPKGEGKGEDWSRRDRAPRRRERGGKKVKERRDQRGGWQRGDVGRDGWSRGGSGPGGWREQPRGEATSRSTHGRSDRMPGMPAQPGVRLPVEPPPGGRPARPRTPPARSRSRSRRRRERERGRSARRSPSRRRRRGRRRAGASSRSGSRGRRSPKRRRGERGGGGEGPGKVTGADAMRRWLERLDNGKGRMMKYLDQLCKEFGDLRQVAACVVPGGGESGVLSAVDPLVFEVLGVESLGHRLILAKGIVALEEQLERGDFQVQVKAGSSTSSLSEGDEVPRPGPRQGNELQRPGLRQAPVVAPPGVWTLPAAAPGAGAVPVAVGAWRSLDPTLEPVRLPTVPQVVEPVRLPTVPQVVPPRLPTTGAPRVAPQIVQPPVLNFKPFSAFGQVARPPAPVLVRPQMPQTPQAVRPPQGAPRAFAAPMMPRAPSGPKLEPNPLVDFGTEEAALHVLIELAASPWHDSRGSVYELSLDAGGTKMTVRTTRPDGRVVTTKNLIHLDPPRDGAGARIAWGVKPSFVMKNPQVSAGALISSASWIAFEPNRTPFEWSRGSRNQEASEVRQSHH